MHGSRLHVVVHEMFIIPCVCNDMFVMAVVVGVSVSRVHLLLKSAFTE